jgi:hypothetical protein
MRVYVRRMTDIKASAVKIHMAAIAHGALPPNGIFPSLRRSGIMSGTRVTIPWFTTTLKLEADQVAGPAD